MQPAGSRIMVMLFCLLGLKGYGQLQPIGQWQQYLSYANEIALAEDNGKIYCASAYSLFSVDLTDQSIALYSKVNGLSDVGISTMGYDDISGGLVIAYSSSNLDILKGPDITNVPGIMQADIPGDKTIYGISFYNGNAYLSSGLGIIVLNLANDQITDTYQIGTDGNPVKTTGLATDGTDFYAATSQGIRMAPVNSGDLSDYNTWTTASRGIRPDTVENIVNLGGRIIALEDDSLFELQDSSWNYFYSDGWPLLNMTVTDGKLSLSEREDSLDAGRVVILNQQGGVDLTLHQAGTVIYPMQAILQGSDVWIADYYRSLLHYSNGNYNIIEPNAPNAPPVGELVIRNSTLWAAAGTVTSAWNYTFNTNGFFSFTSNYWTTYNHFTQPYLDDSVFDFITIAADPAGRAVYAGSFGGGLLQLNADGSHILYKQNTALEPATGDSNSYRISGLDFDGSGNLWITSFGAPDELLVKQTDGNWLKTKIPLSLNENAVSQVLTADPSLAWIVSPQNNGLIAFSHGQNSGSLLTGNWKLLQEGAGNGNLPSNNVFCVARDLDGYIWVGTDNGIGVISCPDQEFSAGGCDAIWPVIQSGDFPGYLLQNTQVNDIAVDGANCKWVATPNGVWLFSPEGDSVIYHFTESNSPLLSNDTRQIAIDPQTGVVYFATFNGIISFRGEATQGGTSNSGVLVFPNPVPHGYGGSIAIRGLVDQAIVKITDITGRLVYETRAQGGQAVWNGLDYTGHRPDSGVYLVLINDELGTEKYAAKFVFIH